MVTWIILDTASPLGRTHTRLPQVHNQTEETRYHRTIYPSPRGYFSTLPFMLFSGAATFVRLLTEHRHSFMSYQWLIVVP